MEEKKDMLENVAMALPLEGPEAGSVIANAQAVAEEQTEETRDEMRTKDEAHVLISINELTKKFGNLLVLDEMAHILRPVDGLVLKKGGSLDAAEVLGQLEREREQRLLWRSCAALHERGCATRLSQPPDSLEVAQKPDDFLG